MTISIDVPFRRSRLRWVIGLAVAAAVLTGWPGASSRRADTVPLPRPPITAQRLAGIWIDDTSSYSIQLIIRPADDGAFAIRSIYEFYQTNPPTGATYEGRVQVIGLGDGPSALLWMDEPIKPLKFDPPSSIDPKLLAEVFEPSGYFVAGYREPRLQANRRREMYMDRDILRLCPIPKPTLMRAVRSGRLKGMIVERPGDIRAVLTDSPIGIRSFLLAYADTDDWVYGHCRFATYGFEGVRRLKWHRPVKDDRMWVR